MLSKILSVSKKEFFSFFASPIAYIFLGSFILVSYFNFFWVDKFFARNIGDLRPLFHSLPLLLIFLVAAVTMRMWSEERRLGTLEFLMTAPVKIWELVFAKFLACLALVALALAMTISLPLTVSSLSELDWGPVIAAYLGALLLASAYIAIGLFISARSDNQIVSLILTILLGSVFYFIGAEYFVNLFNVHIGSFFQNLSSSAHFKSISRGIIDFRDIYYYFSLTAVFLVLNVITLEQLRWSKPTKSRHSSLQLFFFLLIANFIIANFWLSHKRLRLDLTAGNVHTLSETSKNLLRQLDEPLLIRGYISNATHPLLAPLIPQIKDMLEEYQIQGQGAVTAEVIDPKNYPELEEEAGRRYSIRPVPLQISDRYQASLVNAYFDIVVQYGDKYEVLGFNDLIEANRIRETEFDVKLKNLEYDLTRSIKKVVYGFQNVDNLFQGLKDPLAVKAYVSAEEKLPDKLAEFHKSVLEVLDKTKSTSNGKFLYELIDPAADGGSVAQEIASKYGLNPTADLISGKTFHYYLVLENQGDPILLGVPESMDKEGFEKSLEAGLKRLAPGFLKSLGVVLPKQAPSSNPFMQSPQAKQFNLLYNQLTKNHNVQNVDLSGEISESVDLLSILAPGELSEKELYNIDQFLMRGGTVILSTAPYQIEPIANSISLKETDTEVHDWLAHHGISLMDKLVLDTQNENFPVPRKRNLGGFVVEEIQMIKYPMFIDVRGEGINQENSILSGITQVTLNWPSPIEVDQDKNKNRTVVELLNSSNQSWLTEETDPTPNFQLYPEYGFKPSSLQRPHLIGAMVQGEFKSYFKGKKLDFLKPEEKEDHKHEGDHEHDTEQGAVFASLIEKSPQSARIILFASNEFLADQTFQMSAMGGNQRYLNSVQLIENAVDYSLSDPALLSIRGKGVFSKTLKPLSDGQKTYFEIANYVFVVIMLGFVFLMFSMIRNRKNHAQKNTYLTGAV